MPIFKKKPLPKEEKGRLVNFLEKAESFLGNEPDVVGLSGPLGTAGPVIAGMTRGRLLRKLQQLGLREKEFLDVVKKMPRKLFKDFPSVGDATRMLKGGKRFGRRETARLSDPKVTGFATHDISGGLGRITQAGELLPEGKAQIGLFGKLRKGLGQGTSADPGTIPHELSHFKAGHVTPSRPVKEFSSKLTGQGPFRTARPQNLRAAEVRRGINLSSLRELDAEIPAMIFEGDEQSLKLLREIHPEISKHIDTIMDELPLRAIREGMKGSK